MSATTLLLLLLVLACPLSMFFMHRGGGHSHGSHGDTHAGESESAERHPDHPTPLRAANEDAGAGSANGGHSHGGCGHSNGSRHERPTTGAAA